MKRLESTRLGRAFLLLALPLLASCTYQQHAEIDSKWIETTTLERFPHLELPPGVRSGGVFNVKTSLEVEPPPGVDVEPTELELPDREEWILTVILEAPGFELVEGEQQRSVRMLREQASEPAVFRLRAPAAGPAAFGDAGPTIAVSYWLESQFLVRLAEDIVVVPPPPSDDKRYSVISDAAPHRPPAGRQDSVVLDWEREKADLQVLVTDSFLILSALEFGTPIFSAIEPLSAADREEIERIYGDLSAAAASRNLGAKPEERRAVDDERARATAVRAGRVLWDRVAPPVFKKAFWDLADRLGDDFDSIQIYATDPTIPWELMRPARDGEERDFLGLELKIARGHAPRTSGSFVRMQAEVPFEQMLVLQPQYAPPLPGTAEEVRALGSFPITPSIVSSTYAELARISQQLPNGIVHFAGHGVEDRSEDGHIRYAILLGDEPVTLAEWLGLLPEPRLRNQPFIFFNACSVGKTHQSLGFAEGWAPAFLEAGASGYIGTLWPVNDRAAARFAGRFYEALAHGLDEQRGFAQPAKAIREARRLFIDDPDPTYLAYVYYGETDLVLDAR